MFLYQKLRKVVAAIFEDGYILCIYLHLIKVPWKSLKRTNPVKFILKICDLSRYALYAAFNNRCNFNLSNIYGQINTTGILSKRMPVCFSKSSFYICFCWGFQLIRLTTVDPLMLLTFPGFICMTWVCRISFYDEYVINFVTQHIIIKFMTREGKKPIEILCRPKAAVSKHASRNSDIRLVL